ncbi:hypothetical protein ACIGZJ_35335 [Kitasatospora sp. NPDC052868]|uniref:hypothetical protein n=1 Tax=Kitasatospora sp. NPDC052868 TaxID=3364060 RepID=UPI0037C641C3
MDRFEQELVRMMRDGLEDAPYEDRHRARLRAGVRARQRVRTAWTVAGSVLTAGLCAALLVLAGSYSRGGSPGPEPRPLVSAESVTMTSPGRPASPVEGAPAGAPAPHRLSTPGQVTGQVTGPGRIPATRTGTGGPGR